MRLRIVAKELTLTKRLKSHVGRHLRLVLARYGSRVRSATVRVAGPGTDDKDRRFRCRITVRETTGRNLVTEEAERDVYMAVAVAAERSGWQVERSAIREWEVAGGTPEGVHERGQIR